MSEQKKISSLQELSAEEVKDALISGLRARPNATSIYGAKGLTANELKKQYDKYPEILRAKLNELIKVLQEKFSIDENGITHVANDIYVKMADDTIATLSSAIEELYGTARAMSSDISQLSEKADNALQTADDASTVAESASTVANEAHSFAEGAVSLSDSALGIANESKEIASDAYSYARTADQDSAQAKSLAENAESIAKVARKEADDASSIAKGANQAIVFDTEAEMLKYIGDNHSAIGHTITDETVLIVAVDTELITVTESEGYNGVEVGDSIPPNMCYIDVAFTDGTKFIDMTTGPFSVYHDTSVGRSYAEFEFQYAYRELVGKTIKSVSASFCLSGPYSGDRDITKNITYRIYDDSKTITYLVAWRQYEIYNKPIGTNLYIRDIGVPDYWWDGEQAQVLETQKVDFGDLDAALQEIIELQEELLVPDASEVSY